MSIFGKDVDAAAEKMEKAKIKAAEFEGKGLDLQFISVEKIKSQYGVEADSTIVEKGILEEGEQFLFVFKDESGVERRHYSTSMPFFIGMKQIEINEGDWLHVRREGTKDKTRYYVENKGGVSHAKAEPTKSDYPTEDINPDDIPF